MRDAERGDFCLIELEDQVAGRGDGRVWRGIDKVDRTPGMGSKHEQSNRDIYQQPLQHKLSLGIQYRIDPVIRLWFMAADNAGAAISGLGVADWYPPATESGDLVRDQRGLGGGMRIVTDFARAPPVNFIDVLIMEVEHAVTEIGFRVGALAVGQGIGMTAEAEREVRFIKRLIHPVRNRALQQMVQLRSVRGMTLGALSRSHRRVDRSPGNQGLVMAGHAESRPLRLEHVLVLGLMRVMATQALSLRNRLMGKGSVKLALVVAHVAECGARLFQLKLVVALVGVMAIETIAGGNGGMHVFFGVLALVAFVAEPRLTVIRQ